MNEQTTEFDPLTDAVKLLSTRKVKLDVGWTHEGIKFWRFLFNGKPLVCVFANGIILVDKSLEMSKTRRNYFLEVRKP